MTLDRSKLIEDMPTYNSIDKIYFKINISMDRSVQSIDHLDNGIGYFSFCALKTNSAER